MIVAVKERSAGNDSVGDMWLETKVFADDTPISTVWAWGESLQHCGRLMLTCPQNSAAAESTPTTDNSAMDAIVLLDRWWTRYGECVNNGEARIELRHIIDAAQQHQLIA